MAFSFGALGIAGANAATGALQGMQQRQQIEEQQRRFQAQQAAQEQDRKDRIAQQMFAQGLQKSQDQREKASFAMNADEKGYSPYTPGMTSAYTPPDVLKASGIDLYGDVGPNQYEAQAAKQAETFGGFVKDHLSKVEQQAQLNRQRAQQLAQTMDIPYSDGIDLATLEKLYVDRNNQPKTHFDSDRGKVVNLDTGLDISGQPLGPKPVSEAAQVMQAMRAEAAKDREVQNKYQRTNSETDNYRQEPVIKDASQLAIVANKVQSALKQNTPVSDLDAIYEAVKLFDPNSAVREGEIKLFQNANSLPGKVGMLVSNWNSGRVLTPSMRQQIAELLAQKVQGARDLIAPTQARYGQRAREFGVDSAKVAFDPYAAITGQPQPSAPPAASKMFTPKPSAPSDAAKYNNPDFQAFVRKRMGGTP